jgi:serine/threonine protein kinase
MQPDGLCHLRHHAYEYTGALPVRCAVKLAFACREGKSKRLALWQKLQCITGLPMLAALQEMHGKGLIHRDVKPANFGVSPPGYTMSSGENFEGQHQLAYTYCDMSITHWKQHAQWLSCPYQ